MSENGCNYHPYLEERVNRNENKTSELELRIASLEIHKSETIIKLDHIIAVIDELKGKMDKLSEQPTKRLDMIITALVSSGVALIIGYVFAQMV